MNMIIRIEAANMAGPGAGRAAGCPTTAVCGMHGLFEQATDEERDCHHNSDARGIGRARR